MALGIFKNNKKSKSTITHKKDFQDTQTQWIKCNFCNALMYYKEVLSQNSVCPKCNYHFRISVTDRIKLIFDEGNITELDRNLSPIDPLNFVDKKSYKQRIEEYAKKTDGRESAAISIESSIDGIPVQAVIFDFDFMGGSLASVEGEKIVRAINRAIEKKQGLIICSSSGGARMQESTYSLMQMAKTSAALDKLSNAKLPYISILTDPTMGGVSASFAFLGDIIIAEPGATIGFAGARVIKQTIGEDLPKGFQTAEFLLEHGLIDMVVHRKDLKKTLRDLLEMLTNENKNLRDSKKAKQS
ncbi:acetyl-CoA carboxylase, carboxyltransferase subunit beta [Helicobacter sp. 16-1353]|uniref:acetyl-CoA carboxylase, carboxyltransferase subunit beta n=1 Tax=Helicobacter sp. 16-1353 TaxID=2004996 RepID=UPI000DCC8212|nr:acetyl-CoA carboxylase, carboxyltransferase subunit beta [Helicobacter sp. 16-1353]RAX53880.1 acetyl-CoA carboxylase, carboxyltransferase subunit beta [Helicobacter sp. 16-1353]